MMETEPHYNYPTAYPTMMYPPTFNARRSFAAKDMDALVARMENSYITPPAHSTDIWAADSSASVSQDSRYIKASSGLQTCATDTKFYQLAAQQDLPSSYDASAPWCEGYVGAPQDADRGDEDTRHTGQHAVSATTPPTCDDKLTHLMLRTLSKRPSFPPLRTPSPPSPSSSTSSRARTRPNSP